MAHAESRPTPDAGNIQPYRVTAHHLETCNCNHGCGCQFGGFPDNGGCEAVLGYEVIEGSYGDVDMSGVRAVEGVAWPGPIHDGGGRAVLFVDENATDAQVESIAAILSGRAGGMPWELLGSTIDRVDGPIRAAIEMRVDGRHSTFRVPGFVEVEMRSLKNPVTGEPNDVHIAYPSGGLMWDDGAIGTTGTMRLDHQDFQMEHPGGFAAYATPTWTNQA